VAGSSSAAAVGAPAAGAGTGGPSAAGWVAGNVAAAEWGSEAGAMRRSEHGWRWKGREAVATGIGAAGGEGCIACMHKGVSALLQYCERQVMGVRPGQFCSLRKGEMVLSDPVGTVTQAKGKHLEQGPPVPC